MTVQNSLTVTPSHGSVFYIDSGTSPKNDSAYVAYKLTNSSSSAMTNYWVSLTNFSGGKVMLANPADAYQQITIPANSTATVFFLLKATGAATTAQTHTVKVWDQRPDLSTAANKLTCDFSFVKVAETIAASSNKINGGVAGALSPTTATLGGTYVVTITDKNGNNVTNTGKVGNGSSPDGKIFWASPAAFSSWPTRALRLEKTSITLENANASSCLTVVDTLLINSTIDTANCLGSSPNWTATYTFRIIGPGPSSLSPQPVAVISSGTQYKHSGYVTNSTAVNLSGVGVAGNTTTVTLGSALVAGSATASSVKVEYTATIATTSTTALLVDELVDTHVPKASGNPTLVAGTTKLNGTTVADPTYTTADASLTPPPYHFVGPYSVVKNSNVVIKYQFLFPCSATSTSYSANAVAYVGDVMLGAGSNTIGTSNVTTQTSGSSCTASVTDTTTSMDPSVITSPADTITANTANLNGYFAANGNASVTYSWSYSTDPNLVNNVTTSSWTSLASNGAGNQALAISGLSASTTYYFRAQIKVGTGTPILGDTLSFTTTATQYAPSVTTGSASGITGSTVTLSGSVNPNLTQILGVYFKVCTDTALTQNCISDPQVQMDDGAGAATPLVFAANSSGLFQYNSDSITGTQLITGLSGTYYYRAFVTCNYNATYCPTYVSGSTTVGYVAGNTLTFTTGAPTALTSDATLVGSTSATLNGSVNPNSSSTNTSFIYSLSTATNSSGALNSNPITVASSQNLTGSSDISVTATTGTNLTAGTTYYFQVVATAGTKTTYGAVYAFTTLKITSASPLTSGVTGTAYQASLAGMGGSNSYSWALAVGSNLPTGLGINSSGLISGTPSTAGSYSFDVVMTDLGSGLTVTKTFTLVVNNTVTFDSNYTGGPAQTFQYGYTTTALTANSFTRTGYSFAGWATTSTGPSAYANGANFGFASNQTLYALWVPSITVTTSAATTVGSASATLNGSANPNSNTAATTFCYGTTNTTSGGALTNCTSVSATPSSVSGSSTTSFSYVIASGLDAGQTYYFQAVGTVSGAPTYGSVLSFTTMNITTASPLTSGTVGSAYSVQLTGVGGTAASSTWSVGSGLPSGVTLSSTGLLSGTPTAAGSYSFTVTMTNNGQTTTKSFVLVVNATVTFNSNYSGGPTSTTQSAYGNNNLTANGFTRNGYSFEGWATTSGGTVTYTDSQSYAFSTNQTLWAVWAPTVITVSSSAATSVTANSAVLNGSISANGTTSAATFCYNSTGASTAGVLTGCTSVSATPSSVTGSSATGLTYSIASGLVAGTTYSFQAVGTVSGSGSVVYGSILTFTTLLVTSTSPLNAGVVGVNYSTTLAGTGGTGPYTWTVPSGLPGGLTLSSGGVLSGVPTTAGTFNFTVTMTDANGQATTKQFSITVTVAHAAATTDATLLTYKTAQLNGTITAGTGGLANNAVTGLIICYSSSSAVDGNGKFSGSTVCSTGNLWGTTALTDGQSASFNVSAGNLNSGATYYSQIQATLSGGGHLYGAPLAFIVLSLPAARTDASTHVTSRGATIKGFVNPKKNKLTKVAFCWGTDATLSSCADNSLGSQSWWADAVTDADQNVSADLPNLQPHQTYYYRVYAIAQDGGTTAMRLKRGVTGATALGDINSFTTAWADTTAATSVTRTGATLNGNFYAGSTTIAGGDVSSVQICYSTASTTDSTTGRLSSNPICAASLWNSSMSISAGTSQAFSVATGTLVEGTTYYAQMQVTFASGSTVTANGGVVPFTTPATVVFNANYPYGTSPVSTSQTAAGSTALTAKDSSWQVAGYTFEGWATSSTSTTADYANTALYSFTADLQLYAVWAATNYHVNYSLNGGSWANGVKTTADQIVNATFTLPLTADVRNSGYTFNGWTATGGQVYAGGATFTMPANDVTFTANWIAKVFAITFNSNGATGNPSKLTDTYTTGQATGVSVATIGTMVKGTDTFTGHWSLTSNGGLGGTPVNDVYVPDLNGSTSITLYAIWAPQGSKTLTLHSNYPSGAAEVTSTQQAASSTVIIANPFVATGYTFVKWASAGNVAPFYLPGDSYLFNIDGDLYAQWTPTTFDVRYDPNGGSPTPTTVQYTMGSQFGLPTGTSVTKRGYNLVGWNDTTSTVTGTYTMPASDVYFTAVWSPIDYSVTYHGNGNTSGSAPIDAAAYHVDATVTPTGAGTLAKTGYTFAGWNTAQLGGGTSRPVGVGFSIGDASVDLYAQWTVNSYDVRYDAGAGSWVTGQQIADSSHNYGSSVSIVDGSGKVTKSGYSFTGWTYNSTLYSGASASIAMPASTVLFVATFEPIPYTVTYAAGGGTWATAAPVEGNHSVSETFAVAASGVISKNGYTFNGWTDGTNTYTAGATYTVGTSNITLTATWSPKTYTITYDANTATGTPSKTTDSYVAGQSGITPLASIGNMALTVNGVSYLFNGWSLSAGTSGAGGASVTAPYVPDLTGSQSVTLYAIWAAPNSKTVTFHANYPDNTDATSSQSSSTSANLAANTFTFTDYQFVKWNTQADGLGATDYNDAANYSFAAPLALYAVWEPRTYVVTWDATTNGGTVGTASTSYTVGTASPTAPTPTARPGYTFLGWYTACTGGTLVVTAGATFTPHSTVTLCGVWTSAVTYTVLFHANFGADSTTTQVNNTATALTANPFTRSGYTFAGWNTSSNGSGTAYGNGASYAFNANISLYAQWSADREPDPVPVIPTLVITFNYTGGTGTVHTASIKKGQSLTSLPSGTKDHYNFAGWGLVEVTSQTVSAPYAPDESETLFAQWVGVIYTILLRQGDSAPDTTIQYQYGTDPVNLPVLATAFGKFLGWSEGVSAGKPVGTSLAVDKDSVLYAIWTAPSLVSKVYFDGDKSALRADTKAKLRKLATQILASPLSGKLLALGWVKKTGTTSYDQKLSQARAYNVIKFLKSQGVKADFMTIPKGTATQKNETARRVDIYVTWQNSQQ